MVHQRVSDQKKEHNLSCSLIVNEKFWVSPLEVKLNKIKEESLKYQIYRKPGRSESFDPWFGSIVPVSWIWYPLQKKKRREGARIWAVARISWWLHCLNGKAGGEHPAQPSQASTSPPHSFPPLQKKVSKFSPNLSLLPPSPKANPSLKITEKTDEHLLQTRK